MKLNEKLTFSWGHIIAFFAIIFISYISFLGITYLTEGKFIVVGIVVGVIDVVLLTLFLSIQMLKATDRNFRKRISIERTLVFLSPVILAACLFPYSHFWRVYDDRKEIETNFSNTVLSARGMFDNYDKYCQDRIMGFEFNLLMDGEDEMHQNNLVEALSIQLQNKNYKKLKKQAFDWIKDASGATVWNVFMIGNIHTITDGYTAWNDSLNSLSIKRIDGEYRPKPFDSQGQNVAAISSGFDAIKASYSTIGFPNWYFWIMYLGLYFCLMLPYIIQPRNLKSTKHLFYNENSKRSSRKETREDDYPVETNQMPKSTAATKEEDFGTFTM